MYLNLGINMIGIRFVILNLQNLTAKTKPIEQDIEGLKLKVGRGQKPKLKMDAPQHIAVVKP